MAKFVGCVLLALVVLQVQSSRSHAIDSVAKKGLVKFLKSINNIAFKIENYGDEYFADKLKNETQIQEWSVNIQTRVAAHVTNGFFKVYEAAKKIISAASSSDEKKVLDCISAEEPNVLATVKNAATKNGFCNNRLAANLTRGFKATSSALLGINGLLKADLDTYNSCTSNDVKCLYNYIKQVTALVKDNLHGGALADGLKEVKRIYKIMFGQDVPRCNKEFLFPLFKAGFEKSVQNVLDCSTK